MKNKFNPELLKEELKKYKLLCEYDFYQEKKELPEYKNLDIDEADDQDKPEDSEPTDTKGAADNVSNDLGIGDDAIGDDASGEDMTGDIPEPSAEEPAPTPEPAPAPTPEPAEDVEEVDVTSLVKGSEEAKKSADMANHNTQILLQKLNKLEASIANMSKISDKMDGIEKEIIKRNPTPVEKLEMRSLSSYPYSQKLTDYWADKKGAYDVMGNEDKKEEYTLTKDDVNGDYSDSNVKKSFTVKPEDLYEEEDIDDFTEEII